MCERSLKRKTDFERMLFEKQNQLNSYESEPQK